MRSLRPFAPFMFLAVIAAACTVTYFPVEPSRTPPRRAAPGITAPDVVPARGWRIIGRQHDGHTSTLSLRSEATGNAVTIEIVRTRAHPVFALTGSADRLRADGWSVSVVESQSEPSATLTATSGDATIVSRAVDDERCRWDERRCVVVTTGTWHASHADDGRAGLNAALRSLSFSRR